MCPNHCTVNNGPHGLEHDGVWLMVDGQICDWLHTAQYALRPHCLVDFYE